MAPVIPFENKNKNCGQLKYIFYFSLSLSLSHSLSLSLSLSLSPFLSLWPMKRVGCVHPVHRSEREIKRERVACTHKQKVWACSKSWTNSSSGNTKGRKCRRALSVPHSVSQSSCVIILYIILISIFFRWRAKTLMPRLKRPLMTSRCQCYSTFFFFVTDAAVKHDRAFVTSKFFLS